MEKHPDFNEGLHNGTGFYWGKHTTYDYKNPDTSLYYLMVGVVEHVCNSKYPFLLGVTIGVRRGLGYSNFHHIKDDVKPNKELAIFQ